MLQLILGGARSGKSRLAEQRAQALAGQNKKLIYIATGSAGDEEMQQRIALHQSQREQGDARWLTVEEPLALSKVLQCNDNENNIILVDCLTLWLSNCLHHDCWQQQREALLSSLSALKADVILVSNEVGSGIVPLGELSRRFADESGWLHQALGKQCETVTLVVAGLPLELKSTC